MDLDRVPSLFDGIKLAVELASPGELVKIHLIALPNLPLQFCLSLQWIEIVNKINHSGLYFSGSINEFLKNSSI